jgi:hypothetical protein
MVTLSFEPGLGTAIGASANSARVERSTSAMRPSGGMAWPIPARAANVLGLWRSAWTFGSPPAVALDGSSNARSMF